MAARARRHSFERPAGEFVSEGGAESELPSFEMPVERRSLAGGVRDRPPSSSLADP